MSAVDRLINTLDAPLFCKDEVTPLHKTQEFRDRLPRSDDAVRSIAEELTGLNGDEVSRFDNWTNKGATMLGASGLLLSLFPLGVPLLELKREFATMMEFFGWAIALTLFVVAMAAFFLSTWNSLVSLRPRPLCRLDEDDWLCGGDDFSLRELAACKMVTYKNNINIVNDKATKVNAAWMYFFIGCLLQFLFVCLATFRGGA